MICEISCFVCYCYGGVGGDLLVDERGMEIGAGIESNGRALPAARSNLSCSNHRCIRAKCCSLVSDEVRGVVDGAFAVGDVGFCGCIG